MDIYHVKYRGGGEKNQMIFKDKIEIQFPI